MKTVRLANGNYKVESSGGSKFYNIEMFGPHAASCNCPRFSLGHMACKHMASAEEAAKQFAQQGEAPPPPFQQAELTRRAGFMLLK